MPMVIGPAAEPGEDEDWVPAHAAAVRASAAAAQTARPVLRRVPVRDGAGLELLMAAALLIVAFDRPSERY